MKIENMKLRDWGKVKATFNVKFFDRNSENDQIPDEVLVYNFKIVEGKNGLFISLPQERGSDGKYYPRISISKEFVDKIKKEALEEYMLIGGNNPQDPVDEPQV